jgi:hypothetical protein
MDSTYTKKVYALYFGSLNASQTGDYKNADDLVELEWIPKKFGAKVRPSEDKIDLEILII